MKGTSKSSSNSNSNKGSRWSSISSNNSSNSSSRTNKSTTSQMYRETGTEVPYPSKASSHRHTQPTTATPSSTRTNQQDRRQPRRFRCNNRRGEVKVATPQGQGGMPALLAKVPGKAPSSRGELTLKVMQTLMEEVNRLKWQMVPGKRRTRQTLMELVKTWGPLSQRKPQDIGRGSLRSSRLRWRRAKPSRWPRINRLVQLHHLIKEIKFLKRMEETRNLLRHSSQ